MEFLIAGTATFLVMTLITAVSYFIAYLIDQDGKKGDFIEGYLNNLLVFGLISYIVMNS